MSFFNHSDSGLDPNAQLKVTIEDTGTILYDGAAYAVSSTNERGPFDILPYHNNFIALIQKFITIHKTRSEKIDLQIESGVLRQHQNVVEIFVGIDRLNKLAESSLPNPPAQPVATEKK